MSDTSSDRESDGARCSFEESEARLHAFNERFGVQSDDDFEGWEGEVSFYSREGILLSVDADPPSADASETRDEPLSSSDDEAENTIVGGSLCDDDARAAYDNDLPDFIQPHGPLIHGVSSTPIDIFLSIFDLEILELMVTETNSPHNWHVFQINYFFPVNSSVDQVHCNFWPHQWPLPTAV